MVVFKAGEGPVQRLCLTLEKVRANIDKRSSKDVIGQTETGSHLFRHAFCWSISFRRHGGYLLVWVLRRKLVFLYGELNRPQLQGGTC